MTVEEAYAAHDIVCQATALAARARRWPQFRDHEERIVVYLETQTHGIITIRDLFHAYRQVVHHAPRQ